MKLLVVSDSTIYRIGCKHVCRDSLAVLYQAIGEPADSLAFCCPVWVAEHGEGVALPERTSVFTRPYFGGSIWGFFLRFPLVICPTWRALSRAVRAADHVLLQQPSPTGWLAYLAARCQGKPVSLFMVGDIREVVRRGGKYRGIAVAGIARLGAFLFHRMSLRMARGNLVFVAGSDLDRRFAGVASDCVRVIPSTVMEQDMQGGRCGWRRQPMRLLFVGRLVPVKGVDLLLRAVKSLSETGLSVQLSIVGDGPSHRQLMQTVKTLGIERQVEFLGWVAPSQLFANVYPSASVLILPSLSEGVPKVLLEAMAVGLPVVASNVGGIPDLVKHGVTGLLVSPGCVQDLASAIRCLMEDPGLQSRLGQNAWRAARRYTVETQGRVMREWIRTYDCRPSL